MSASVWDQLIADLDAKDALIAKLQAENLELRAHIERAAAPHIRQGWDRTSDGTPIRIGELSERATFKLDPVADLEIFVAKLASGDAIHSFGPDLLALAAKVERHQAESKSDSQDGWIERLAASIAEAGSPPAPSERTPRQILHDTLEANRKEVESWPASLRNAISFDGVFDLPPPPTQEAKR